LVVPDGTELSVSMVDPGRTDPDPPGDSGAVRVGARGEVEPVGVSGAVLVGLRGEMGSVGVAEGGVSPLGMTVVGVREDEEACNIVWGVCVSEIEGTG
jgi:hypothetical protein